MTKTALIILAPGFEEIEAISTIDILRRAGITVTIASLTNDFSVKGKQDMVVQAETSLQDALIQEYDALILPGGPGTFTLLKSELLKDTVLAYSKKDKLICAICAAPLVLQETGLLEGKGYTAHFSVAEQLHHIQLNRPVIQDGKIITANGPGAAIEFGLIIVKALISENKADDVATDICFSSATV